MPAAVELKPGLWNNIHAVVDYGDSEGFVEGSEFMPEGYPFTAALKVLCEGGVVEFMFRAGGVSVEMGGATLSSSTNPANPTPWKLSPATLTRTRHPISLIALGAAACPLPARRRRRGSPCCVPKERAGRSKPAQWLRFSVGFAPFDCCEPARAALDVNVVEKAESG